MPVPVWAKLGAADLKAVISIADFVHRELQERAEVFAEKMSLYSSGAWKLCRGTEIVGYGLFHPWLLHDIPPLDDFLERLPQYPDCLYIHDVAVLPSARGHGSTNQYMDIISQAARNDRLAHLACVSVYGTDALWSRYGFQVVSAITPNAALAKYGPTAKYMTAPLSSD